MRRDLPAEPETSLCFLRTSARRHLDVLHACRRCRAAPRREPMLRPDPFGSTAASADPLNASCSAAPRAPRLAFATGHQHQELVASPAEHVVGLADVPQQERRDLAQDPIAGFVPERVVDALEVIDVDEHDRQRHLLAAMALSSRGRSPRSKKRRLRQPVSGSVMTSCCRSACAASRRSFVRAQLVGHVLERHELHAERGQQIQTETDEQRAAARRRREAAPTALSRRWRRRRARASSRRARADQPACAARARGIASRPRQRSRGQQMPGREHGGGPSADRREREPDQHQAAAPGRSQRGRRGGAGTRRRP